MKLDFNITSGLKFSHPRSDDWRTRYARNGLRPVRVYDFVADAYGDAQQVSLAVVADFTRASVASYFDGSQDLVLAAVDEPRFAHDSSSGVRRGLLLETAATNLIDEAIARADKWTGPVSRTNRALGALGFFDGVALASQGVNWHRATVGEQALSAGQSYAISVYGQLGTSGKFRFDFRSSSSGQTSQLRNTFSNMEVTNGAGVFSNITVDALPNNVFCLCGQFVPSVSGTYSASLGPYSNLAGESIIGLGAQLEVGSTATSFYPASSGNVTRAADVIGTTGLTGTYDVIVTDGDGVETILFGQAITEGWWPNLSASIIGEMLIFDVGSLI
jgi:hypothetical protein